MRPTALEIASALSLQPHPEGGFFRETYRAATELETPRGRRSACTAILFLVTAAAPSCLHSLTSDELWVFQGGLPLELVTLAPDGTLLRHVLGDSESLDEAGAGEAGLPEPQALAPAGCWQGARLAGGVHLPAESAWSLVTCVVTPGFDFADFAMGRPDNLLAVYPQHEELIRALT